MRGDIDGNLNPDNNITRAEFVTIINRAFGYETVGATPFNDVEDTDWYAEDVAIAYTAGVYHRYVGQHLLPPCRDHPGGGGGHPGQEPDDAADGG